ncbi:MAG: hypothetical protein IT204_06710 [Fimbriimonadaceae bacterium]|nr:hypothetical protein [Fimbriimonadaceae bacterium]
MDADQVYQVVVQEVANYGRADPSFPVVDLDQVRLRQEGDWFYVTLTRKPPYPTRSFPFFDQLREIEEQIAERHHVKVLLVPARAA